MQLLLGIAAILGILIAAAALTAFAVSLIVRDKHPTSGSLGTAMLEVQTLFDPAKKQVLEARREAEEGGSGERASGSQ